MKKKILLVVFTSLSICTFAQRSENRDIFRNIIRGPYETNSFLDNWFVGLGIGFNISEGDFDKKASIGSRLAPALDITVGKWITPYSGMRMQYSGLTAKGLTSKGGLYARDVYEDLYKKKFGFLNFHVDYLWNLSNGFWGYNQKRIWNFIPYAGLGLCHSYGNDKKNNNFGLNLGFLNTFRLTEHLDLSLELRQLIVKDDFDGQVGGNAKEGVTSVTFGVNYNLGKSTFSRLKSISTGEYEYYNNYINKLRSENKKLEEQKILLDQLLDVSKQKLAEEINRKQNTAKSVVYKVSTPAPVALFFDKGKAELDAKELTNLAFYVKNVINVHKDRKFLLLGMVDFSTGTKESNLELAEKRMDFIYNVLTTKYRINGTRLSKKIESEESTLFTDPMLNRSVIIQAEGK